MMKEMRNNSAAMNRNNGKAGRKIFREYAVVGAMMLFLACTPAIARFVNKAPAAQSYTSVQQISDSQNSELAWLDDAEIHAV